METADSTVKRRLEQRVKRDLKRIKRLGKHPYPSNRRICLIWASQIIDIVAYSLTVLLLSYVQPPIDVKLSEEIVGSLRLLQVSHVTNSLVI